MPATTDYTESLRSRWPLAHVAPRLAALVPLRSARLSRGVARTLIVSEAFDGGAPTAALGIASIARASKRREDASSRAGL